jgi:rhodanese-related sulfurtransferase
LKHSEAFEKLVEEIRPQVKEISIPEVLSLQSSGKPFIFLDVREDHEWQEGRALGSQHLGRGILERDIEKIAPDKSAQLVLYCGGGYRSCLAAYNLQKMGYQSVFSMIGGIRQWRQDELPEEK